METNKILTKKNIKLSCLIFTFLFINLSLIAATTNWWDGDGFFTGDLSVNDINVRNESSVSFGSPPFAKISAINFNLFAGFNRTVVGIDADFSIQKHGNFTTGLAIRNIDNNTGSNLAITLTTDNSTTAGIVKQGINHPDPYELYFFNERGDTLFLNTEKNQEWGFSDDIEIFPDLSVGEALKKRIYMFLNENVFNINNTLSVNFAEHNVNIRKETIISTGFLLGEIVNIIYENFNFGMGDFKLLTSPLDEDAWDAKDDELCYDRGCAIAGRIGTGQPVETVMGINFSTQPFDNLNLTFRVNTTGFNAGDYLNVTANNNSGSGDIEIFSTIGADANQLINYSFGSIFNNVSNVTIKFSCSVNQNSEFCAIDNVLLQGNATEDTTQNISRGDGDLTFGFNSDGLFYVGDEVTGSSQLKIIADLINASETNLIVNDLTVVNGSSIKLAGATFENAGFYTMVDTNFLFENNKQPGAFIGVYADNESNSSGASLVLRNNINSSFNIFKSSEFHPWLTGEANILNQDGAINFFVDSRDEFIFSHYVNLTMDEYGKFENLTVTKQLLNLGNDDLNYTSFFPSGGLDVNGSGIFRGDFNVTGRLYAPDIYNSLGSGWLSGGGLAYNPGTNTFNLSSTIHFILVNQTDGHNIRITDHEFPAQDNISIGTVINQERWVALGAYPNGTTFMDFLTLDLSATQRRDYAIVGRVWTDENGFILGTGPYVEPAYGYGKTAEDLIVTLGSSFNIEGNIFGPNGVNMLLNKDPGEAFRYGAWSQEQPGSPNIGIDPAVVGIDEYYYFTSNATTHNVTSEIQIQWENDGVLEEMPANKFQCQYIWHWSYSQVVAVQYGQRLYSKIEDAQSGCPTDEFNVNAELVSGAKLRAWLIFKTGTTDLSDTSTVDFLIAPNIWFGSGASGGGTAQIYIGDGEGIYVETNGVNIIHLNTTYTDDRYFNTPNETGDITLHGIFTVFNSSLNVYNKLGHPSSTISQIDLVSNNSYGDFSLYRTRADINLSVKTVHFGGWDEHSFIWTNFGIKTENPVASLHVNGNVIGTRLNIGGTGFSPYVSFRLDNTQEAMILNRLTTAKRDAIGIANATETGMFIFNTDTNYTEYFDGTAWVHTTSNITEPISAADVSIALGGGSPTVDQMQEYIDNTGSSGFFLGGNLSDGGSGTVDVDAGEGFIRTTDDPNAQLQSFKWNASSGIAVTDNTTQYIYVDNSGTISLSTNEFLEAPNKIKIGVVTDEAGSTVHTFQLGVRLEDGVGAAGRFLRRVFGIQRNNRLGGLILGQSGDANRDVTMTSGQLEWGRTSYPIASFNTAGADTFFTYSESGLESSNATQFPNTQYDNSGTLTEMNNNRWANLYFFLEPDDHLIMIYGRAQYVTEAQAENEGVPSTNLPSRVSETSILVGRFTFKKSADTATISSAFETLFANAGVTSHNNLANLDYATAGHIGFMSDSGDIATGNYTFDTDTLFIDADNHLIGIGTTDPKTNLHILTSGTSELGSVVLDRGVAITGIGGRSRIYFEATDSTSGERVFAINDEGGLLSFGSLNDTATAFTNENILVLDHDTGNVGIGTSSPVTGLEVKAPLAGGSPFKGSLHLSYPTGLTSTGISMDSNISGVEQTWLMMTGSGEGNNNFRIFDSTLAVDRFNIQDGTGNVGIGTTNPLAQLSIGDGSIADSNVHVQLNAKGDVQYYGVNRNDSEYGALFGWDNNYNGTVVRSVNLNDSLNLVVSNTYRALVIEPFGNIGMGVLDPTNKLDVYSIGNTAGITINGDSNPALTLKQNNIVTGYLASVSGDGNYFTDALINDTIIRGEFGLKLGVLQGGGGPSAIAIDSSNNVGIGTSNISAKLHLFSDTSGSVLKVESEYGPGGSTIELMSKGNGTNWGEAQVILSTNQSTNRWFMFMDDSGLGDLGDANRLGFWDGGATVMTLDGDNDRVGIGTTSPNATLQVDGNAIFGTTIGVSQINNLTLRGDSDAPNFPVYTIGFERSFWNPGENAAEIVFGRGGGAIGGDIRFNTQSIASTLITRMHIAETGEVTIPGNVGIGTSNPSVKLQVEGTGLFNDSGGSVILQPSDGSIEIVRIAGTPFIDFKDSESEDYDFRLQQSGINSMGFHSSNISNILFLNGSTGRVGIGTTNPTAKLSVESSLHIFSPADTANIKVEGISFAIDSEAGDNFTDSRMFFLKNDDFVGSLLHYDPAAEVFSLYMLNTAIDITEALRFAGDGSLATIGTDAVKIDALAGAGNDYACLDSTGTLFRSNTAC